MIISFGIVLLAAILISGIAHRTVLSTAVLFLAAGFFLGHGMFGVITLRAGDSGVSVLAQLALFVVLFTDGQRISVKALSRAWRLPGRALLLGMPITFVITTALGVFLVGLPLPEALLVAAVLAPTDPVFASAIVGRNEIPARVRGLLNIESGLNDGLALPVVLILVAAIGGPKVDFVVLAAELIGGILLGVAVPLVVAWLMRIRFLAATPLYAALGLNLVLLANLAVTAWLTGRLVAGRAKAARIERWQTGYLPVFLVWVLLVVLAVPPLFSFA